MQQWEYLGVRLIPESEGGRITVLDPLSLKGTPLNALGRQGWEVVGVFRDNFWVLLKRPVAPAAAQPIASAANSSSSNTPPRPATVSSARWPRTAWPSPGPTPAARSAP